MDEIMENIGLRIATRMFKASSEGEALEMLAIAAGYASIEEADKAVFVATGRCPEPTVDELSDAEAQAIDDLIAGGMSQYHALEEVKARRKGVEGR